MVIKRMTEKKQIKNLTLKDLQVGDIFEAHLDGEDRSVFLKVYNDVVDLKQPMDTYSSKSLVFNNVVFFDAELHVSPRA